MFISVATCDAICDLNKLPPGLHQQQFFQTKFIHNSQHAISFSSVLITEAPA
jgi:hypothetical protein